MAKRKYSVSSRVAYHRARANSSKTSVRKKAYSLNWLDGYTDRYARDNYAAVCSEISRKKGKLTRNERAMLYGYRNGLKAQLEKNKNRRALKWQNLVTGKQGKVFR